MLAGQILDWEGFLKAVVMYAIPEVLNKVSISSRTNLDNCGYTDREGQKDRRWDNEHGSDDIQGRCHVWASDGAIELLVGC